MDKRELKELFTKRLYLELQLFKDAMLCKEKTTIFEEAYKIETMACLYEILLVKVGGMPGESIRGMLFSPSIIMV